MEQVVDRENLNRAYLRVVSNKGSTGVDGMRVDELLSWILSLSSKGWWRESGCPQAHQVMDRRWFEGSGSCESGSQMAAVRR